MTPYRERRARGDYGGGATQSTTTDNLAGLGAPQQAKAKPKPKKKPSAKKK